MKALPNKPLQYPFYILLYWLILWALVAVIININLTSQSTDGYILARDCVREKDNVCVLFSANYKVPLWQELTMQVVGSGILIGATTIVFGFGKLLLFLKTKR